MDMFLKVFWNFIVLALRNTSTRVALRVGAESTGRDNDPGGLGDMPNLHGPILARAKTGTVFGTPTFNHQVFPTALL